jgi:hypothetical protein
MSIDLTAYQSIETALFCKIDVPDYSAGPLLFSGYNRAVTIDGDTYTGLGQLLDVSSTQSDLRATGTELQLSISGIPNSVLALILSLNMRGSPVQVLRAFFDAETKQLLSITGNPAGRFYGKVNNYAIEEQFDNGARTASSTVVINCSSYLTILENKIAGRRTNSQDQKRFFPTDISMDRVVKLANANFQFGAPSSGLPPR